MERVVRCVAEAGECGRFPARRSWNFICSAPTLDLTMHVNQASKRWSYTTGLIYIWTIKISVHILQSNERVKIEVQPRHEEKSRRSCMQQVSGANSFITVAISVDLGQHLYSTIQTSSRALVFFILLEYCFSPLQKRALSQRSTSHLSLMSQVVPHRHDGRWTFYYIQWYGSHDGMP